MDTSGRLERFVFSVAAAAITQIANHFYNMCILLENFCTILEKNLRLSQNYNANIETVLQLNATFPNEKKTF